jgi:hypothetical protein
MLLVFFSVLVPLVALLSYLGGPLYMADTLEPMAGGPGSVAIGVLPLVAAVVCAFSLLESHPWNLGTSAVIAGLLAVVLVSVMNGFAIMQLMTTPDAPDNGLMAGGVAAGVLSSLAYVALAIRRFWRSAS